MTDSVAKLIILEVSSRCLQVKVVNGFHTDAGLYVFRGRTSFNADVDPFPCMSIFAHEDDPIDNTHADRLDLTLNISVEIHSLVNSNNPLDLSEDLVADVKKAVLLLGNRNMGGLCEDIRYAGRRELVTEDGSNIASVQVHFEVRYPELYGDPHTVI